MNIYDLVKKNGGALTLNLAHDEEYDYILEKYGGSEKLEEFPVLKNVLKNTKTAHEQGKDTDYRTLLSRKDEKASGLSDAVYVAYGYYDAKKQTLSYCGVVSLVDIAPVCNIQIDVFDANEKQISKSYMDYKNQNFMVQKAEEKLAPDVFVNKQFRVVMTVSKLSGKRKIMEQIVASRVFYIDEILSKVEIAHPIKKVHADDTINVFYGRFPGEGDRKIDYIYKEAYIVQKNCAEMTLDMMGEAQFADQSTAFYEAVKDECDVIMDFKRGAIYYGNKNGMEIIGQDKSGLGWYFDRDWDGTIPNNSFQASNRSALTMVLRYKTEKNKDKINTITMSSLVESDLGVSCKHLREFDLKIGCLAKGTLIWLADGSYVPIEKVKCGDKVVTDASGSSAVVRNTWSGKEETMIVIETMNGHSVTVSGTHLVVTNEGLIEAQKMNAGMQVMTEDGSLEPILYLYDIIYADEVYNLELEVEKGKGRMFADKIQVGDYFAQGDLKTGDKMIQEAENDELVEKLYEEFCRMNGCNY